MLLHQACPSLAGFGCSPPRSEGAPSLSCSSLSKQDLLLERTAPTTQVSPLPLPRPPTRDFFSSLPPCTHSHCGPSLFGIPRGPCRKRRENSKTRKRHARPPAGTTRAYILACVMARERVLLYGCCCAARLLASGRPVIYYIVWRWKGGGEGVGGMPGSVTTAMLPPTLPQLRAP